MAETPGLPSRPAAAAPAPLAAPLRGISNALWYLDTPAAIVRSAVDYGIDGTWENPLDANARVSADDLAEKAFGVTSPVAKFVAGTALGVALDPLSYVSGPLKALSAGGKAAKASGLLDDAAEVASKALQTKLVQPGAAAPTGRAARALSRQGRTAATFAEHGADPLVSTRAAQMQTTLDDLIANRRAQGKWTADSQRHLDAYLTQTGQRFDDIRQQKLSGTVGLGGLVGNPLGTAAGTAVATAEPARFHKA